MAIIIIKWRRTIYARVVYNNNISIQPPTTRHKTLINIRLSVGYIFFYIIHADVVTTAVRATAYFFCFFFFSFRFRLWAEAGAGHEERSSPRGFNVANHVRNARHCLRTIAKPRRGADTRFYKAISRFPHIHQIPKRNILRPFENVVREAYDATWPRQITRAPFPLEYRGSRGAYRIFINLMSAVCACDFQSCLEHF